MLTIVFLTLPVIFYSKFRSGSLLHEFMNYFSTWKLSFYTIQNNYDLTIVIILLLTDDATFIY